MKIITILLLIIAISEISRLLLTHWPKNKRGYFKSKIEGVEKMIYDLEFKRFKTKEIREEIRVEYDNMKSRLHTLDEQIKSWPADKEEGDRKKLEDNRIIVERDIDRFEKQIKGLDLEVEGSRPTNDYPDGVEGINDQIDSLQELIGMLKDWIRRV